MNLVLNPSLAFAYETVKDVEEENFMIDYITIQTPNLASKSLRTTISDIKSLQQGWDGYGASAPSKEIINKVEHLLEILPNHFIDQLNSDSIYPNPNGTITIEWSNKYGEMLSLEIGESNATYFLTSNKKETKFNNRLNIKKNIFPNDLASALKEVI